MKNINEAKVNEATENIREIVQTSNKSKLWEGNSDNDKVEKLMNYDEIALIKLLESENLGMENSIFWKFDKSSLLIKNPV